MNRSIAAAIALSAAFGLTGAAGQAPASATANPTFTFHGAGWGHGVGMSQWGAYQQAKIGRGVRAITASYYTGATLAALDDTAWIRVNIGYRLTSAKLRSLPLAAGGGKLSIVTPGTAPMGGVAGSVVELSAAGSSVVGKLVSPRTPDRRFTRPVVILQWAGTRTPGINGPVPTAIQIAKNGSLYRTTSQYRYGQIAVFAQGGRLSVVNLVRIRDEYLPGIAEVSAGWPLQAQQAQAVAARSYALSKTVVRPACACHSDDGSGPYYDQTFVGYSRATSYLGHRWVAAVKATQPDASTGWTLTHAGKPIPAFYFASSGGRTANSEDVWGGYLPYTRSVADPWSIQATANPDRMWSSARSMASVASAFGLPNVAAVTVVSRYSSGQVRTIQARSSTGATASISGGELTSRLGLRSKWVNSIERTS